MLVVVVMMMEIEKFFAIFQMRFLHFQSYYKPFIAVFIKKKFQEDNNKNVNKAFLLFCLPKDSICQIIKTASFNKNVVPVSKGDNI